MDDSTRPLGRATSADAPRDLAAGERIADWVVVRTLASGGFGTVYEVTHAKTGERAALKLLHAHLVTSVETLARFDREIRVITTLKHPNAVRLVDAGFVNNQPYLCMEMLDGEELGHLIDREGKLGLHRALEVLEPICDALAAAHQIGIIHRDIKASNIMLCSDGRVVLLDFGIARINDALALELTASNQSLGTPSCMAPEQIRGARPDSRTDVYAAGGLLFHMLTGRMPFQDPSATMTQYLHLHARRPRASLVASGIPEQIDDVVSRAMAIEPAERFVDTRTFLSAALAASRETKINRAVGTVDTVALLVAVADRTGGTAFDAALFEDLEGVLPAAERFLAERGFVLAVDLGASAIFVAACSKVPNPTLLALETFERLESRPHRDARVQVGLCVHRDGAPFVGTEVQPCALVRPVTWPAPDPLDGVWVTGAIEPPTGRRVR